ncbi:relaxin-3-like [Erpetoichthys calabaricus]|uniref:Relaxin-3-like n=1 Tax=Erpetoichthys calabaricus TaxID=27687 RepID=A0A8C4T9Y6_ERPCA|nr:relaxin-3-like [Erpetoichthys calabaricus]
MLRFVALVIVCLGSMCVCPGVLGTGKSVRAGEYGVKLCGREFIRAVIFTCGGSRWKRLDVEAAAPVGPADSSLPSSQYGDSSKDADVLQAEWHQKMATALAQGLVKELSNPYDDYGDYEGVPNAFSTYLHQTANGLTARSGTTWRKSPLRKRDSTLGIGTICCKWGCTRAEISALC